VMAFSLKAFLIVPLTIKNFSLPRCSAAALRANGPTTYQPWATPKVSGLAHDEGGKPDDIGGGTSAHPTMSSGFLPSGYSPGGGG
jgi:hypothetical protein